jgi:hypothetical protein
VRPELKGIQPMREGVYYHLPQGSHLPHGSQVSNSPSLTGGGGRTRSNSSSTTINARGVVDEPGTRRMYNPSLSHPSEIGTQRNAIAESRRSINSLAQSVTIPDQRQRINVSPSLVFRIS